MAEPEDTKNVESEPGDPKNVGSDDALLERYYLAVGRLVDRFKLEVEEFVQASVSPEAYVLMLERLMILQRLTMGVPVTPEEVRFCLGTDVSDSPDKSSKG